VTPEREEGSPDAEPSEKPAQKPAPSGAAVAAPGAAAPTTPSGTPPEPKWWHKLPLLGPKPATGPSTVKDVENELGKAQAAARWTDVGIRKWLGYGSLIVLFLQLAVADVAFFIYGYSNKWVIPASAIEVWLAAIVVQLFIIVRGIGNYLFPPDDSPHGSE